MRRADDPSTAGPPPARGRRAGTLAGLAVIAVAVVAAIAFGISRADDPGEVVIGVVALHDRPAQEGPPAPGAAATGFAVRARREGWVPAGARVDRVEGREGVTAFWERAGRRIAHTTVSGEPVDAPDGARRTGRRGVLLRSFEADGRIAVTWTEAGHTAVISAVGVSRAALYDLAGGRPLQ